MNKHNKLKNIFHKEIKCYAIGFLLSILFTVLPFICTLHHFFSKKILFFVILFCALTQIIVHFVYFLHLDFSKKNSWNITSLFFILIIVCIIMFGSIWIMYNLNHHIMI